MNVIQLYLLRPLLSLLGRLPLPLNHALGWLLGWLLYIGASGSARMMRENLRLSGICPDTRDYRRTLRHAIGESGKAIVETFAIWRRDEPGLLNWVRRCDGWDDVEAALAQGKGIIFLTPHLGCFEITSLYYAAHHPITVLYRPPKQSWMLPFILSGRTRGSVKLAPATTRGVRDLLQALKQKEAIGILPDQIPAAGEGEWAPYFGRPAYTMTLASRLAQKTGAAIFMVFGERLALGRGYHLHFTRLPDNAIDTVAGLNAAVEDQVGKCPQQYLWSYHRHKIRRGAKPLNMEDAEHASPVAEAKKKR